MCGITAAQDKGSKTNVTKWGCPPTVSSSFSRKVKSLASPGRRHSSSCSTKECQSVSHMKSTFPYSISMETTSIHSVHVRQNQNHELIFLFFNITSHLVFSILRTEMHFYAFIFLNCFESSDEAETEFRVPPHQNGDDSFKLLLHQVTDNLVVKILHRLPLQHDKTNTFTSCILISFARLN